MAPSDQNHLPDDDSYRHQEETWKNYASCLGYPGAVFFPDRGKRNAEAKAVCSGCLVQEACLRYAVDNNIEHGIWGGMSQRERSRYRRALRRGQIQRHERLPKRTPGRPPGSGSGASGASVVSIRPTSEVQRIVRP